MLREASVRSSITIASIIYVGLLSAYLAIMRDNPLITIPTLVTLLLAIIRRFRGLVPIAILASGISCTSLVIDLPMLFIPIALSLPFIFSQSEAVEEHRSLFIGPTISRVLKYVAGTALLVVIDARVLTPIAIMTITSFVYALIYYIRLSRVKAEVMDVPRTAVLGRNAPLILAVTAPRTTYVLVEGRGSRVLYRVKGSLIAKFDLPTDHVGRYSVAITVSAIDSWGFSCRLIKSLTIKYSVVPLTSRVIEVLRRRVFSHVEIIKLVSEVEVVLMEIGEELGVPSIIASGGGGEVAEVLREYVRKVRIYLTARRFIERLAEVLEELSSSAGGALSLRRGRVGEYLGARYYSPGDSLRDIHWKKSLSKQSLIVKEFSTSGIEEALTTEAPALEPVIIVDLFAPNNLELDRIVFTLLTMYFSMVRRSPLIKSSLLLITGDLAILMRGKVVDILYRLYKALEKSMPQILFEYEVITTGISDELIKELVKPSLKPRLLSVLVIANKLYAERLVRSLAKAGVLPPKPFTIIHSTSLSLRYGVVKNELSSTGYTYVPLRTVADIAAAQLRRR